MTESTPIDAIGGQVLEDEIHRANANLDEFIDDLNKIWDDKMIPRGIIVGSTHRKDVTFLITRNFDGPRTEDVYVIWRNNLDPMEWRVETNSIILKRTEGAISAHEVPNSAELFKESDVYIVSDDGTELLFDYDPIDRYKDIYMIDIIHEPLFTDEAKESPIDPVALSVLVSTFDMADVGVIDWREDIDDWEDNNNWQDNDEEEVW